MTKANSQSATVSVREAHQLLGGAASISLNALYRAVKIGQVPSLRVGSRVLISRGWINRQLQGK
jgi:HPt (histidine-containing phosphotransfer) domain-containing protein